MVDYIDRQSGSGRLDLLLQVPYEMNNETQKERAKRRKAEIEDEIRDSEHGIAFVDGVENVIQLNRPVENNLLKQVEMLTSTLYGQLTITPEILNGSAKEEEMLNYYARTVAPVVQAILDSCVRTFLTSNARSRRQTIMAFRDVFKLAPLTAITEFADKVTRNEILSPNEVRAIIGIKPSSDPKSDELRNRNINSESADDQNTGEIKKEGDPDAKEKV